MAAESSNREIKNLPLEYLIELKLQCEEFYDFMKTKLKSVLSVLYLQEFLSLQIRNNINIFAYES